MSFFASCDASILYSLHGHIGRCFDIRADSSMTRALTCSEDGTARLWDIQRRKELFMFDHSTTDEVLRCAILDESCSAICTAGADGKAILWALDSNAGESFYVPTFELNHKDQIYSCEGLSNGRLLTAADDEVHIWDLEHAFKGSVGFRFENIDDSASRVFGGERNPDNKAFVFDAKVNPMDESTIAVALSDGTLRIIDIKQKISPGALS